MCVCLKCSFVRFVFLHSHFLYFGLVFVFRFNVVLVFKVLSLGFELCALRLTLSFRRYSIVRDVFMILYVLIFSVMG